MWPDPAQVQSLLEAAGRGQSGAVDSLLARHRDALRRFVAGRLDPGLEARLDASDVVQDVCLQPSQRLADILFDTDGKPYVADFGLARRLQAGDDVTASHTLLGTPGYMAPEQAQGQRAGCGIPERSGGSGAKAVSAAASIGVLGQSNL